MDRYASAQTPTSVETLCRDWYCQRRRCVLSPKRFPSSSHTSARYPLHPSEWFPLRRTCSCAHRLTRFTYSYFCEAMCFFTNQLLPARDRRGSVIDDDSNAEPTGWKTDHHDHLGFLRCQRGVRWFYQRRNRPERFLQLSTSSRSASRNAYGFEFWLVVDGFAQSEEIFLRSLEFQTDVSGKLRDRRTV